MSILEQAEGNIDEIGYLNVAVGFAKLGQDDQVSKILGMVRSPFLHFNTQSYY